MPVILRKLALKRVDMRTNNLFKKLIGVTLMEMIVFIVVVSIALTVLTAAYNQSVVNSSQPLIRQKALNFAQAKMDEVMALKYDAMTPTGGVPACDTAGANPCNNTPDADMNDVDDFHNQTDIPDTGYQRQVTVTRINNVKRIQVRVTSPDSTSVLLTAERANF
jgi:MSHA pilin protein MshD